MMVRFHMFLNYPIMQLVDKYRLSATFLQGGELELFKDGVCSSGHNYMVTSVDLCCVLILSQTVPKPNCL
jgi:hypothetical protein